jgi:uncharacterized membrane protein YphA (DoxX/SURF4 family)
MSDHREEKTMNTTQIIASWILQVAVAFLLIYAGIPKLVGEVDSVALFSNVPGGDALRYLTGVLELAAALLILLPRTIPYGAILASLVMAGALGAHVLFIGFAGEMATMASMAGGIFTAALAVAFLRRSEILRI